MTTEKTEPKVTKIAWQCHEVLGHEVLAVPRELWDKDLDEIREEVQSIIKLSATQDDSLVKGKLELGQVLLCFDVFGWSWTKVSSISEQGAVATSSGEAHSGTGYFLEYADDDRKCWVCIGAGNLDAVRRLTLLKGVFEDLETKGAL